MKRKVTLLLVSLFLGIGIAAAQTTVGGTVVSEEDGQPVVGAAIRVSGTKTGTTTDANGKFSIALPQGKRVLSISYIGMDPVEVVAKNNIRIVLRSSTTNLNEVIVTALGITRNEKSLGYSATKIDAGELTEGRVANVAQALQGKVAGVQIQSTSNDPGAQQNIIIRGFSSINGNNQPLYVVDGVPLQSGSLQTSGHAVALSGLSNINPDDIESMTVLKGAAATALYGSRAANGVIIITTKSGKKSESRNFSIEYNGGVQLREVSLLPTFQNDFGQGWNGTQTFIENGSWGPRLDGSQQVYGPIWNYSQLIHEYSARENNVKEFFDIGTTWNNSVSLSGASDDGTATYYLSYSNDSEDGIMPSDADSCERNTLAFRASYKAAKWLKLSSSVNLSKTHTDIVGSYQGTSVIDGLYELPRDVSLLDKQDLSSAFNTPEAYFTPYGITNPFWALANNYNHNDGKQIYGKLQLDINPIKELTLTYRFGFDYTDYDHKIGEPGINLDDALITDDMGYPPSSMNQDGYVYTRYSRSYELNNDFLANYKNNFVDNRLTVDVTAGVTMNERYNTTTTGETDGLTFETGFWDLSNGATITSLTESRWKRRLVGLLADATFGWDDTYYLDITARNDWSSTLPLENNSYFYPGVTATWIFSNLLPKNKFLSFGKLRLAYGKTGNDASVYLTNPSYIQAYANGYYGSDIASFPMNSANSFILSSTAPSTDLKPEMTTEYEIGTNVQFFGGRVDLDVAYYNRSTNDQIFTLPVDPSTGYSYKAVNFGEVRNQGWEIALNTTPVKTAKWRWDLGFNYTKNKNKVISMPESLEGGRVTIYSFSAGNDAVYMYAEEGKPMGEYYTYLPQKNDDGQLIVDEYGQPVLGSSVEDTGKNMNHKWTAGATTALSAFGFTLSAALDVRYGGYMFSRTKNLMQFTGNGIITTYNDRKPFVIPNSVVENEDGTYSENTSPIYLSDGSYQDYFDSYGWGNGGESYLVKRDMVKLRNITLTWQVPRQWTRRIYLSDISLSAFVNNAFIWTASDNYYIDPETTTTGTDLSGQFGELYTNPSCRIYGFNLKVKF